MKWALVLLGLIAISAAADAQSVGGMSGVGGGLGLGGGGAPVVACTNQLILDYSNSCALIAQGWGQ